MNTDKTAKYRNRRKFLRLPLKAAARIHFSNGISKTVVLTDISIKGLAFIIKENLSYPEHFTITFKIKSASQPVKAVITVCNTTNISDGIRIGCKFYQIDKNEQEKIENFLWDSVRLSTQFNLLSWTSFIFSIDSIIKLFLTYIYWYYTGAGIGITGHFDPLSPRQITGTIIYAIASTGAFLLSEIISRRDYKNFLASLILLSLAFIVLVAGHITYFTDGGHPDMALLFFKLILVFRILILGLGVWCISFGFYSLKKIRISSALIKEHTQKGVLRR